MTSGREGKARQGPGTLILFPLPNGFNHSPAHADANGVTFQRKQRSRSSSSSAPRGCLNSNGRLFSLCLLHLSLSLFLALHQHRSLPAHTPLPCPFFFS